MFKFSFFIILAFLPFFPKAQLTQIEAKIINEQNEAIALAAIVLKGKGKGTISDENGFFKIISQDEHDTLQILMLGYNLKLLSVKELFQSSTAIIVLQKKALELPELTVLPENPKDFLKKAIEKLPEHLLKAPYQYNAFYRQYHKEDGKAARLIESDLNIYKPAQGQGMSGVMNELVQINQIRRSNVYEKNGDTHDNHLNDLLLLNPVYYPLGTVLNPKGWKYYKFSLNYSPDKEGLIIISYAYENSADLKLDIGKIFIDALDYRILRIEQESIMNVNFLPGSYSGTQRWKYLNGHFSASYRNHQGKVYTDSLCYHYKHLVTPEKWYGTTYLVEEFFELYSGEIIDNAAKSKNHKGYLNLYTHFYGYNEEFWKNYPLLLKHPLCQDFNNSLERHEPLEKQFRKNGR